MKKKLFGETVCAFRLLTDQLNHFPTKLRYEIMALN